jgi:hypothetical protein
LRMYLAHPVRVGGLASSNQHVEMLTGDFERRYLGFRVLATVPRRSVTRTLDIGTTLPSVKRRRARMGEGSDMC